MKITDVKVWLVEGIKYNWTMLKIYTDEGYTGVGEATNWPGSPMIEAATRHAGERIIGMNPMQIDYIWTKLYRDLNWVGPFGASMCAISGIDMALLDLKGKILGVPVYDLLGGSFRKEIPLYANYWFLNGDFNEADYAAQARKVVEKGFTGLKFDPFAHTNYFYGNDLSSNLALTPSQMDHSYAIAKSVRQAVGSDVDIMIETHAMLNAKTAITMGNRLADLNITWFEEPLGPENPDMLKAFRDRLNPEVSICVGERHYTRYGIQRLLELGVCDIMMPDITRCGGPSEMKRMATMMETYNVMLAPHNPNGPLSTIASAHVCASVPNFFRQEFMVTDVPWRDTIIDEPLAIKNGKFIISDKPGLGVDLLEDEMEKHPGLITAKEGFYV
ncbi:mandelate racemase/muconate lactonizing enzyme family protein [Carboxylicivirga sp. M1479]|uniref:mandelate racemase/muconate lactonizing enzyme family protein n=1 Tax=Carboxylicivirga sp. M1479 TaxID=2594476 RepID=UPI001177CFBB|nr:mandelate racemase/muconate lactonizing enzyme family protein [Carboxylicivirga sp. M1479]TRX71157.1 mandelate racemase/muconate lactonizing enzyme family protein [Carboxylicivirga sp. M1479]